MAIHAAAGSQLLYKQVEDKIREAIANEQWKVGARIPGENELSKNFGVSRVTLRSAISHLVDEGLLVRLQGKGTFVTSGPFLNENHHRMKSFTDLCHMQNRTASAKIIFAGLRRPDDVPRNFLSLAQDENAFVVERVRLVDHVPILIEISTFKSAFQFLQQEDLTQSLYAALAKYNVIPDRGIKTVGICNADDYHSQHLNIPVGTALLISNAMVHNEKSEPLHYVKQVSRADLPEIFQYYV